MPEDHIRQWRHNRRFIRTIEPEFPDWAVTATFYAALHAVDAVFKSDNLQGITSHQARNQTLIHTSRYANIWQNYQPLYGLSRTVRYLARPSRWIKWAKIETDLLPRYLYPLEKTVQKLIGVDLSLKPISLKKST
ncbi:MAG: hypothetical protein ACLFV7_03710 [Phycisphaerae bacterium]